MIDERDDDPVSWEHLTTHLGVCGCVSSTVLDLIHQVLKAIQAHTDYRDGKEAHEVYKKRMVELLGPNEVVHEFVLHMLDNNALLEHGTNIDGSFIGRKGPAVLALMDSAGLEEGAVWKMMADRGGWL